MFVSHDECCYISISNYLLKSVKILRMTLQETIYNVHFVLKPSLVLSKHFLASVKKLYLFKYLVIQHC